MRGGGEGSVGVIGAGTSAGPREAFYNVEMQRETPGRKGLRDLQLVMTDGFAKRFTPAADSFLRDRTRPGPLSSGGPKGRRRGMTACR